jgi:predicted metal-binding protein
VKGGLQMITEEALVSIALESGVAQTAILETSMIQFHEEFRKACEKNICRKYDTNWMGPPAIGPISELKQRVLRYPHGLLFQSTHAIASNFDMKGMIAGAKAHAVIFRNLLEKIRSRYPAEDFLPLDAGCCSVCDRCAYLDSEPCRNSDLAVSSVEAYGMNVIALQKSAGVPYYYGKNTVCYVGLILFGAAQEAAVNRHR